MFPSPTSVENIKLHVDAFIVKVNILLEHMQSRYLFWYLTVLCNISQKTHTQNSMTLEGHVVKHHNYSR